MLRALIFALLLTAASRFAHAQQTQVLLAADTAKYGISLAKLRAAYLPVAKSIDNTPSAERNAYQQAQRSYARARAESVEAQGVLPAEGFYYGLQVFYRPDGYADWVVVMPPPTAPAKTVDELLRRLTVFYQKTPFPKPFSAPFHEAYGSAFGRIRERRTIRTGDSTISTLDAARATARPDTVKYVFFNQLDLTNVPDVLYRFPNLEELDLSKNGLTQLPARLTADLPRLKQLSVLYNQIGDDSLFIAKNRHLRALTLQGNKLTRIPAAVRNARNLESLWMGNNKLKELNVGAIRGLKQLVDLNFYNAGLTSLPRQVRKLKRVRVLDLYYNELTALPKQIGNMRRLEQLAVAHNKLTGLPPQLAKLKRLDTLYVHHNPLSALPATFAKLPALRLLDLSYSRFSEFPAALTYLNTLETIDLSGNNIQTLPASVTQLTNLKQLYLRSNPVTQDDAKIGPYAKVIDQLEANKTEVFY